MLKKIYRTFVYFPFLFLGCFLILYFNWLIKLKKVPSEFDEAGSLGLEWLISLTIYLWFISIFIGIVSLGIMLFRRYYLSEKESNKIIFINIFTVIVIMLMYIFNIGYSLSWLLG